MERFLSVLLSHIVLIVGGFWKKIIIILKKMNESGDNLKKETFQMRISKDTRADLDRVAKHYNLSASATVDMLIAKETRLIDKQRKEDEKNGTQM